MSLSVKRTLVFEVSVRVARAYGIIKLAGVANVINVRGPTPYVQKHIGPRTRQKKNRTEIKKIRHYEIAWHSVFRYAMVIYGSNIGISEEKI